MRAGVAGMALAIVGTLLRRRSSTTSGSSLALVVGTAVGVPLSRVPLTAVPQRTALSHAFGGLAAGLVGTAKYMLWLQRRRADAVPHSAIVVEVMLGFLTFTGSLMAAGKLQEVLPTRPITYATRTRATCCCSRSAVVAGRLPRLRQPDYWPALPGRSSCCRWSSACC